MLGGPPCICEALFECFSGLLSKIVIGILVRHDCVVFPGELENFMDLIVLVFTVLSVHTWEEDRTIDRIIMCIIDCLG